MAHKPKPKKIDGHGYPHTTSPFVPGDLVAAVTGMAPWLTEGKDYLVIAPPRDAHKLFSGDHLERLVWLEVVDDNSEGLAFWHQNFVKVPFVMSAEFTLDELEQAREFLGKP